MGEAGAKLPEWHALPSEAVLAELGTTAAGLAEAERAARLARYGPNAVAGRRPKRWLPELLESFGEPLQLLLIAVAVLSAVFGEPRDAIAIGAVVVLVAVLETATEMRAARSIEALRAMTAPTARLVRGGGDATVPAADVVPGDVLRVAGGDVVAADARVLSARGLRVDESTLSGEAAPVGKSAAAVAAGTGLAERSSMLFAGTAVCSGEGTAVVTATGTASELGRLGRLVAEARQPPTPLQRTLSQLARAVLVLAIGASLLVPAVGLLAGQPWRQMVLSGLTVAFATVPEELPILVVVLLAVGGRRLARRGALLRRLRAGETLGEVTAVVTDKTGTLTENRLRLAGIDGDRQRVLATALATQPPGGADREPMEEQLAAAAAEAGIGTPGDELAAFPFDPQRALVSRAYADGPRVRLAVAGAPEVVLARCTTGTTALAARVTELAGRGQRVIAFAERDLDAPPTDRDTAETALRPVGLAWFTDPLRTNVSGVVAALRTAGVATILATGDHPATATAVAAQAGLPAGTRLHGAELSDAELSDPELSDPELAGGLADGTVIARATPGVKHRVVAALQRRGEVVAFVGDGANDAPALAAADVGIALGRRGAELARAAAGLILTDDAYSTVLAAIAAGRNIGAQLRRAVAFYLGAKLALVLVLLAGLAGGLPVVFAPVHIVLLEMFMDLGASVAFVAEPAAPDAMRRPPRPPGSRFLDRTELATIAAVAATLTLATLPGYLLLAHTGTAQARGAAVLGWLVGHTLIAWTLRTRPGLPVAAGPAFPAWAAVATAVGLVLALTPAGGLVGLAPLVPADLLAVAGAVAVAVAAASTARRLLRLPQRL